MATLEEFIKASDAWEELENIPIDPDTECIKEAWHDFPAGTHREDIWHWFENTYHVPVHTLMFPAQLVKVEELEYYE